MTKPPPVGTRVKTPSGRFARITGYDREGFVNLLYYDGEGGENDTVTFSVRLLAACDVITPPDTKMPRETNHGRPLESIEETKQFWAERTGRWKY